MALTALDKLEASQETGDKIQNRINSIGANIKSNEEKISLMNLISMVAEAHHADFPQYQGHWDSSEGWTLVKFHDSVVTKLGTVFKKGDFALLKSEKRILDKTTSRTAFSVRGWIDVSVFSSSYSFVMRPENP